MKYKTVGNCPFCDSEISGDMSGWGMSPEGWEGMRKRHLDNHPENEPLSTKLISSKDRK